MYYVNVVMSSLVLGFGFSMLIACLLLLWKRKRLRQILHAFMETAMFIIRWVGLLAIVIRIAILLVPEESAFMDRVNGPYAWAYWMMTLWLPLFSQLLWIPKVRSSILARIIIALGCILTSGVFFEEFVILTTSLHRDSSIRSLDLLGISMTYFTRIASFAGLVWLVQSIMARRKLMYYNN